MMTAHLEEPEFGLGLQEHANNMAQLLTSC